MRSSSSRANRSARTLNVCLSPFLQLEVGAWPTIPECRIYLKGFTQKGLGRSWAQRLTELEFTKTNLVSVTGNHSYISDCFFISVYVSNHIMHSIVVIIDSLIIIFLLHILLIFSFYTSSIYYTTLSINFYPYPLYLLVSTTIYPSSALFYTLPPLLIII